MEGRGDEDDIYIPPTPFRVGGDPPGGAPRRNRGRGGNRGAPPLPMPGSGSGGTVVTHETGPPIRVPAQPADLVALMQTTPEASPRKTVPNFVQGFPVAVPLEKDDSVVSFPVVKCRNKWKKLKFSESEFCFEDFPLPNPALPLPQSGHLRQKVLVFGGNGFISSELVNQLIATGEYDITIISRGNVYYDSDKRITPFVQQYICDREDLELEDYADIMTVIDSSYFKFVFDFSCFKPQSLEASLQLLNSKTDLYVYISSSAVYEVCGTRGELNHVKNRETDSLRLPLGAGIHDSEEEFSIWKLMGEKLLDANRRAGGCSYLILRLPDVIGPRDTTKRTWFYILWIQFFEILKAPIIIPKHVQAVRASYVFARDVVRAIFHLTTNGFRDDVFNVGFEETLTLHKFLKLITSEMGKENVVEFDFTADETCNVFPSLSRGAVDVTKLKETGFQPTTPKEAIRETIKFYKDALSVHEAEGEYALRLLAKYLNLGDEIIQPLLPKKKVKKNIARFEVKQSHI